MDDPTCEKQGKKTFNSQTSQFVNPLIPCDNPITKPNQQIDTQTSSKKEEKHGKWAEKNNKHRKTREHNGNRKKRSLWESPKRIFQTIANFNCWARVDWYSGFATTCYITYVMVISQKFPVEPKYDGRTSLNLVSFQVFSIHKTFCNIFPARLLASRVYVSVLDSSNKPQSINFFHENLQHAAIYASERPNQEFLIFYQQPNILWISQASACWMALDLIDKLLLSVSSNTFVIWYKTTKIGSSIDELRKHLKGTTRKRRWKKWET